MTSSPQILCVGQLVADLVIRPVDKLPNKGELLMVTDLQLVPGGCACNTACALARLGANVMLSGLVGVDAMSNAILSVIDDLGVDTTYTVRDPNISISTVGVLVDSQGERSFYYRNGGSEAYDARGVDSALLSRSAIVHVGGAMKLYSLDLLSLLKLAKSCGCVTSIDTDWDPTGKWLALIKDSLPYIDYLSTNISEGEHLTQETDPALIARRLIEWGASTVIVKRAELGCLVVTASSSVSVPGFTVEVVDTTCAGDSFVAGFLLGVSRGLSLSDSARLGNAAGALCTTAISQQGIQSLDYTLAFAQSQGVCIPLS